MASITFDGNEFHTLITHCEKKIIPTTVDLQTTNGFQFKGVTP